MSSSILSKRICACVRLGALRSPLYNSQRSKVKLFGWGDARKSEEAEAEELAARALEETRQRKYKPRKDGPLIRANLNNLATKRLLTTKKGYTPPADVSARLQQLVEALAPGVDNWLCTTLSDSRVKYDIVTAAVKEFKHDVSNYELSDMHTAQHVLDYFSREVRETTTYEDLSRKDLPPNLHIQWEYMRFHPDKDTMFDGKSAFPNDEGRVTSIKYSRKYEGVGRKTCHDVPGWYDAYHDY